MNRAEFEDWIVGKGGAFAPIDPPHEWTDTRGAKPQVRHMIAVGEVGPITNVLLADGSTIVVNTSRNDGPMMDLRPNVLRLSALIDTAPRVGGDAPMGQQVQDIVSRINAGRLAKAMGMK